MNPHLCRLALRPRGPFEVFDLSFRFLRERARPMARMAAMTLLPTWIALSFLCWLLDGHWALFGVALGAAMVLRAPFTLLGGRLLFSDDTSVLQVIADLLRSAPALASIWMLRVLGWAMASVTCFVVLPWVQGALLYLTETALLERVGPQRGLRRTWHLSSGHIVNAAMGTIAGWVLLGWFTAMGEATGQALVDYVFQLGQPFGALVDGRLTPWALAGVLVSQPLFAIYRLLLYVDVRTRVEGWDLQVGLRAAGMTE